MIKMSSISFTLSLAVLALVLAGCHGSASVTPAPIKMYGMNEGTLNTAMLDLGFVAALNPVEHTASLIYAHPLPANALRSAKISNLNEVYSNELNFDFSADVPQSVQIAVKAQATANLRLKIESGTRVDAMDGAELVRSDPGITAAMIAAHKENKNLRLMVVTGGIAADKVDFGSDQSLSNTDKIQVFRHGLWTIDISYKAGSSITGVSGENGLPMLIKANFARVNENDKVEVNFTPDDLSQYNFRYAIKMLR